MSADDERVESNLRYTHPFVSVRVVKEKAARLVASGQFERAEVLLRQALSQSPRDVQTWLKHAEVLKRLSRNVDAVSSYRLAARILDESGHHHRAVTALKLGLALLPDDIELITDIIRLEMRARKSTAGVRSVFPLSSPSQLLGDGPTSSESSLYSASSGSALAMEEAAPQLALPMESSVSPVPRRLDTWVPPPTPPETPAAESPNPAGEASSDAADVALFALITPTPSADAPAPSAPAPEPDDEAADEGPSPANDTNSPFELEVEGSSTWPQVRRLSETRVAMKAAEGASWVVVESTAAVSVRFDATLEIPDDAEWLE